MQDLYLKVISVESPQAPFRNIKNTSFNNVMYSAANVFGISSRSLTMSHGTTQSPKYKLPLPPGGGCYYFCN